MGRKLPERVEAPKGDRFLAEAEAGARFDVVMSTIRSAWAEAYPSEPFSVDGKVTPKAREYIRGYVDGLQAGEDSDEPTDDQS